METIAFIFPSFSIFLTLTSVICMWNPSPVLMKPAGKNPKACLGQLCLFS